VQVLERVEDHEAVAEILEIGGILDVGEALLAILNTPWVQNRAKGGRGTDTIEQAEEKMKSLPRHFL
jgi:hypothetical protein